MAGSCGCQSTGPKASRSLEEGLECPVCWEGFDDGENAPYVLWCGHSLCRTCVVSLEWATVKLSGLPLQLPLFVACPWCQFLTFRCKWRGQLRYPCKNFFLLWVVESLQGEHGRKANGGITTTSEADAICARRGAGSVPTRESVVAVPGTRWGGATGWRRSGTRVATSLVQFTARIPLILLFLFIVVYVLPFSTLVLALYCLITVLFAVPSFLVVYFSYPSLDWLVRAIASG